MTTTRRGFLNLSLAAGAVLAARASGQTAQQPAQSDVKKPGAGLKLLVLGGTGFLGPAIVEAARARGHTLTLFNRGKTHPGLFTDIEQLHGDRDPDKGEGIKPLAGRKWDAVFDDCGYYPRMVKASAELLAPRVEHYIYISSISAYAKNDVEGGDETAAVATMDDPTIEKMGDNSQYYGPLKALCEHAAEKAMPGRVANVRPGYIVGPGDPTDRFTYWPVRLERGGDVLVPGSASDPIQVIDVRDLAEWLVLVAEKKTTGVFNACGPEKRLNWGETIDACKTASATKGVKLHWVGFEKLEKLPEQGQVDFPIWAPYSGDSKGSHTWSNARAVKAGLTFRPIATIAKDTLAWWKSLPEERRAKLRAGPAPEREAELLETLG